MKTAVQNIAGKVKPSEVMIDATTGQRVAVPKRSVNELLQDPLFRVKSGEEFRQRYGAEVTNNLKVRTALGKIEQVADKADQLKQLQTLEADVLVSRIDSTKLEEITKVAQSNSKFPYKTGTIFEKLITNSTAAKSEVDNVVSKISKANPKVYGKPDNIQIDANGKIVEIEEVKFYGKDKLERFGVKAKENPEAFVKEGLGKDGFIQFVRHIETLNKIKADITLIEGEEVKGVADKVKYVLTLPKYEGDDFLKVNKAVKEMQKAWKSQLGIDVEVRYSDLSTTDIQLITQRLSKGVK